MRACVVTLCRDHDDACVCVCLFQVRVYVCASYIRTYLSVIYVRKCMHACVCHALALILSVKIEKRDVAVCLGATTKQEVEKAAALVAAATATAKKGGDGRRTTMPEEEERNERPQTGERKE